MSKVFPFFEGYENHTITATKSINVMTENMALIVSHVTLDKLFQVSTYFPLQGRDRPGPSPTGLL